MSQVPDHIRERIYRAVAADLRPARPLVHAKIGAAVGVGGLLSLFLCGQLGLGLTGLAMHVHHWLMAATGSFGCTATCGVVFAVVPVVTLRLISPAIQFQALIRNEWSVIAAWILAFGAIVIYQNDRSDPIWIFLLWGAAATASFGVLSRLLHYSSIRLRRGTSD